MKLKYLGHSCFLLDTGKARLIFDPHKNIGYDLQNVLADAAVISHHHYDHDNVEGVDGVKKVILSENIDYDGVKIESFFSYHDEKNGSLRGENYIHKVTADGISVCHLGDFGENPDEYDFSSIGKVDFLLIPVGGKYTVDADNAKKIVDAVRPDFIVPMHYKTEKSTVDISSIDGFLRYFMTSKIMYRENEIDIKELFEYGFFEQRVVVFKMPDGQDF